MSVRPLPKSTGAIRNRAKAPRTMCWVAIALLLFLALGQAPIYANDPPQANDDQFEVDEDTTNNPLDVLANDYDPDEDTLTIVAVTQGTHGAVNIIDGGARLTYTPDPDYFGSDAFTYTISDGHDGSDTARVDVTVNGINDPPNANDDSAITDEDIPVTIDVLDNDDDIDGNLDPTTVRRVSGPSHGSVSVNFANGKVTYTPAHNWNGADTFTYRVCDDGTPLPRKCSTATVYITVEAVNDPPIPDAGPDQSVYTLSLVTLDGSGSTDPEGDLPLTYDWQQKDGTPVDLSDPSAESPTFSAPDDPDVLTFALRVYDSHGLTDFTQDEVVVTVNNQAPVAHAGPDQMCKADTLVTLDGSRSYDPDHDLPLTYLWSQFSGPSVVLNDPTSESPTFIAPDEAAVLIFRLLVIDQFDEPASTSDQVVILVREKEISYFYMPLALNPPPSGPDLVVQSLDATANSVQVVIANQGNVPVAAEFFVDVYIDPHTPPTAVNQTWDLLATQGMVWGVTQDALSALVPGGSLTLRLNGPYYEADYSYVDWPLPVGTTLYAQVDSFNPATDYGTVLEIHEEFGGPYNNIGGPYSSTAAVAGQNLSTSQGREPSQLGNLPPRP